MRADYSWVPIWHWNAGSWIRFRIWRPVWTIHVEPATETLLLSSFSAGQLLRRPNAHFQSTRCRFYILFVSACKTSTFFVLVMTNERYNIFYAEYSFLLLCLLCRWHGYMYVSVYVRVPNERHLKMSHSDCKPPFNKQKVLASQLWQSVANTTESQIAVAGFQITGRAESKMRMKMRAQKMDIAALYVYGIVLC